MRTARPTRSGLQRVASLVACVACTNSAPLLANNGVNLIGFGAESVAMGGADLAVARDSSALNTNPAGLAQIDGARLDMHSAVAYLVHARHVDVFGNSAEP